MERLFPSVSWISTNRDQIIAERSIWHQKCVFHILYSKASFLHIVQRKVISHLSVTFCKVLCCACVLNVILQILYIQR